MEEIKFEKTEIGKPESIKENKSYKHREYVIQALMDGVWKDVIHSYGNITTANKKARHYRNKYSKQTRVVEIEESINYTYHYYVTDIYAPNTPSEQE